MRRSMVVGLFLVLMLGLAAPAWAQATETTEAFVVLSGRAHVPEGQTVGDLVVVPRLGGRGRHRGRVADRL